MAFFFPSDKLVGVEFNNAPRVVAYWGVVVEATMPSRDTKLAHALVAEGGACNSHIEINAQARAFNVDRVTQNGDKLNGAPVNYAVISDPSFDCAKCRFGWMCPNLLGYAGKYIKEATSL